MLDFDAAHALAEKHVNRLRESGQDLVLNERQTQEHLFGWVFFYNSRDFVEKGDERTLLVGAGPFIVDRETGEIHEFGTGRPLEHYVREYEQSRRVS